MTTAQNTLSVPLVLNTRRTANNNIEGPTNAQARRMAAYRQRLMADAQSALAAGDDERAFDLDCQAWDIESDLQRFGFNTENGRVAR